MDRPRRSGRASHAPDLGYPSPTVQSHASSPAPAMQANSARVASSSRLPNAYGTSHVIGGGGPATASFGAYGGAQASSNGMLAVGLQNAAPAYGQHHHFGTPTAAPPAMPSAAHPMMQASNGMYNGSSAVNTFPLGRTAMPVPPQLSVGPGQARFTTFASRAKMGVSTLMQPLPQAQDFNDPVRGGDYGFSERSRIGGSRRRAAAGRRYYGEDVSDFDDEDDEQSAPDSPSKANTPLGREEEEEPQQPGAFLGLPPPGNKTFAKRAHRAHPIAPSENELREQAEVRDFLIPIKIELETDTHRIRDTFTWNMREQIIRPREFAKVYVRDLDLPADPYATFVEAAIVDQMNVVKESGLDLVDIGPAAGGPFASQHGQKRSRDVRAWDWGIKRAKRNALLSGHSDDHEGKGENLAMVIGSSKAKGLINGRLAINDTQQNAGKDAFTLNEEREGAIEDDLRVTVDYDVQIYRHHLRDRLEWDLCSPLTPEAFAEQTCKDLCLSGEALPIIANAVREQLLLHLRSAVDLELIGKGAEHARWQYEIEDAESEIAENYRRHARGLPSLAPKPLRYMQEEPEEEPEVLGPRRRRGVGGGVGEDGTPLLLDNNEGSGTATPTAGGATKNVILRTPEQRKSIAEYWQFQLTEKGPRRLEGVWREYQESREFGPLLEMLSDADLERLENEAIRASRRGRRDQQRSAGRTRARR